MLNKKQKIEIMFSAMCDLDNFNRYIARILIKYPDVLQKKESFLGNFDKNLKDQVVTRIKSDSSIFLDILSGHNEIKNELFYIQSGFKTNNNIISEMLEKEFERADDLREFFIERFFEVYV